MSAVGGNFSPRCPRIAPLSRVHVLASQTAYSIHDAGI
jgi:hypothetical protein